MHLANPAHKFHDIEYLPETEYIFLRIAVRFYY